MTNHISEEQQPIPPAPTSHDLGALMLLAGAAQAMGQMQPLTADKLRLLAAYRKNADSRRLFQSVVRMVNSLP